MATTVHVSDVAELLSEGRTHFNLSPAVLVEHSIRRNEAKLAANGCIVGYTNRTGPVAQRQVHRQRRNHRTRVELGRSESAVRARKSLTRFTSASWSTCAAASFLCRIFSAAPIPPTACRSAS